MEEKKYKCAMCGSEAAGTPGTCCEKEREEVCVKCGGKTDETGKCPACSVA